MQVLIGEWKVDRESVTPSTPQFDVLQWLEGMPGRLPQMYRVAQRTLAFPNTSYGVECSFFAGKRVHSEQQLSMKEGTQKAYVSFCFNGVVPPPIAFVYDCLKARTGALEASNSGAHHVPLFAPNVSHPIR